MQQGLETKGYELGPLSTIEGGVRQFHDFVQACVPATKLEREPLPGELARLNAELRG